MNFIACDGLIREDNKNKSPALEIEQKIRGLKLKKSLKHKIKIQSGIKNSKKNIYIFFNLMALSRPGKFLVHAPVLDFSFSSLYLQRYKASRKFNL